MLIVGSSPDIRAWDQILGYVAAIVLIAVSVPWLLISAGCIVVGCLAIARGETTLIMCFPAGLAMFVGPASLLYLERKWYPPISGFTFDGNSLQFEFRRTGESECRAVEDVLAVRKAQRARGRLRGYYVTFRDQRSIFVPRCLTHADDLYDGLRASLATR